ASAPKTRHAPKASSPRVARPLSRARVPRSRAHRSARDRWPADADARNVTLTTPRRPHLPALADRRAAEHFDDAGAGCSGGVIGQRIEGEETMPDDLAAGNRCRQLAECSHDEERDV